MKMPKKVSQTLHFDPDLKTVWIDNLVYIETDNEPHLETWVLSNEWKMKNMDNPNSVVLVVNWFKNSNDIHVDLKINRMLKIYD